VQDFDSELLRLDRRMEANRIENWRAAIGPKESVRAVRIRTGDAAMERLLQATAGLVLLPIAMIAFVGGSAAFAQGPCGSAFPSLFSPDDCWLAEDRPLLAGLRQRSLAEGWTYSMGGEFRYRYMD
jgi:hypothetical protein